MTGGTEGPTGRAERPAPERPAPERPASPQPAGAKPLDGQVALITGSSRGIGQGIAWHLASLGAVVAVTSRSRASLGETLRVLREVSGRDGLGVELDVRDV